MKASQDAGKAAGLRGPACAGRLRPALHEMLARGLVRWDALKRTPTTCYWRCEWKRKTRAAVVSRSNKSPAGVTTILRTMADPAPGTQVDRSWVSRYTPSSDQT